MNRDGHHSPIPEQDVVALVRDIRRLGRRLLSIDAISDPQVQSALHQLDRQVAGVISPGNGRHRLATAGPGSLTQSEPVRDTRGYHLKPNPLAATTSAQLVSALRQYRGWAGNIPYRQMAARAQQAVAHSTMFVALNSAELPALKVVIAIILGCGGSVDDQQKFATAWRRINSGNLGPPGIEILD